MSTDDRVYINLQQHLDRQAVGFPATRSGAELKILRHIFSPREAEVATFLSYRHAPLETIYDRVRHLVASPDELKHVLAGILKKGGIEAKMENGRMRYGNAPLVVGMYELQVDRLSPAFIRDFDAYTSDINFGLELLGTALPQMRTIPISKSIRPQHRVSSFDEVAALLQDTEGPFAILDCICRKKKRMAGESCQTTARRETCLGIGGMAQSVLESGIGREIDCDEALAIIGGNQKEGLVLQPSNTVRAEFICSCCGCCCGMLRMHQRLPKPVDFWATNFYARVERTACNGCGVCRRQCQVCAVDVPENRQPARIDLNRCLGCGHCVAVCPREAITLKKKAAEVQPPETREALYDILKAHRQGPWGKAKLTGKLILDMLRTRHTGLLG